MKRILVWQRQASRPGDKSPGRVGGCFEYYGRTQPGHGIRRGLAAPWDKRRDCRPGATAELRLAWFGPERVSQPRRQRAVSATSARCGISFSNSAKTAASRLFRRGRCQSRECLMGQCKLSLLLLICQIHLNPLNRKSRISKKSLRDGRRCVSAPRDAEMGNEECRM